MNDNKPQPYVSDLRRAMSAKFPPSHMVMDHEPLPDGDVRVFIDTGDFDSSDNEIVRTWTWTPGTDDWRNPLGREERDADNQRAMDPTQWPA